MEIPWWREQEHISYFDKKPTRRTSLQMNPMVCLECKERRARSNYTGRRYIDGFKFWRSWYEKEIVHCPKFFGSNVSINTHPIVNTISLKCERRNEHIEFSKPLLEWLEIKELLK